MDSPPPTCPQCGGDTSRVPSAFSYKIRGMFTRSKQVPTNDVELDALCSAHGNAPIFGSQDRKDKAEWALRKARMGDFDKKI